MTRRRAKGVSSAPPPNWDIHVEWKAPSGRTLTPGTELSIAGVPGRFRFVHHVTNRKTRSEWITVVGGRKGLVHVRSFRPGSIKRVHRIKKLRPR